MAKSTVPVNFKDDIMNSAMGGKRRYRMINNSDGTISLEDVTTYDQVGSTFGAAQMNATNKAVNAAADASKIIDDIDTIRATTQAGYMAGALALKQVDDSLEQQPQFVYDETGKITGYTTKTGGADTVFPFSGTRELKEIYRWVSSDSGHNHQYTFTKDYDHVLIAMGGGINNAVCNSGELVFNVLYDSGLDCTLRMAQYKNIKKDSVCSITSYNGTHCYVLYEMK